MHDHADAHCCKFESQFHGLASSIRWMAQKQRPDALQVAGFNIVPLETGQTNAQSTVHMDEERCICVK